MNYGLHSLSDKDASWLSICLCPLFLDDGLIKNTKEMTEFLNSILPSGAKQLGISFGNTYFGYNWYIPSQAGEPMPDDIFCLFEVHHNGLFIFGKKIEEAGIPIDAVGVDLKDALSMASELYSFVRYSGFFRMALAISNIRNRKLVKARQPYERPSKFRWVVPLKEDKLILSHNLQTDDILLDKEKVLELMLAKLQQTYGLEVYAE